MSATPRPWKMDRFTATVHGVKGVNDGIVIADCCTPNAPSDDTEQLANATLIVCAVNQHDALVNALESCIRQLQTDGTKDGWPCLDQAKAALKGIRP